MWACGYIGKLMWVQVLAKVVFIRFVYIIACRFGKHLHSPGLASTDTLALKNLVNTGVKFGVDSIVVQIASIHRSRMSTYVIVWTIEEWKIFVAYRWLRPCLVACHFWDQGQGNNDAIDRTKSVRKHCRCFVFLYEDLFLRREPLTILRSFHSVTSMAWICSL